MTAIILQEGQPAEHYERIDLQTTFAEKWLQATLQAHPELVPMGEIDPSASKFIPLCRELRLPKLGTDVFLDLLGVTPHGRLALVECKLWRNPQARREVVAQILEYASLLRRWSFADLSERISKATGRRSPNPLYDIACEGGCFLSEAAFCDAVAKSLRTSDFHLIIAGDGIREDTGVISGTADKAHTSNAGQARYGPEWSVNSTRCCVASFFKADIRGCRSSTVGTRWLVPLAPCGG